MSLNSITGWWAISGKPFSGRLLRVSLQLDQDGQPCIQGAVAKVYNLYDLTSPYHEEQHRVPVLPHGAWPSEDGASYALPHNHPSPDAGLSCDVLEPKLVFE
jgi:hypothetical protein